MCFHNEIKNENLYFYKNYDTEMNDAQENIFSSTLKNILQEKIRSDKSRVYFAKTHT